MLVVSGAGQANAVTPPSVGLGTADSFDVLGASTVTNTGNSVINDGDVGLFPGSAVVGFPPAIVSNGVIHSSDAQAEQAQNDVVTAYNDAAGRTPDESNIIDLGGRTLVPGVYSGDALSITGDLTLDGDASSVFIFQAASTLITGSASRVLFTGGANQCNVFWKVGTSATLGSNSTFVGTILALTAISADTGASITGRLFARTAAVTLDDNTIVRSSDCAPRSAIVASTPSSITRAAIAAAAAAADAATARAAAIRAAELAATGVNSAPLAITGSLLVILGSTMVIGRRFTKRSQRHRLG
ncbi:DUF3494 domain-containing protein [Glaciihabitans sp. INWT7]|uniref:ice-binding family protein n=1 Tax=Glaciihabitans sp. INWT7 TaxID=2596912 RepID=UPI0016266D74|nr:ice-binding family protein [Glaciihabitans sp. INWT7]QNE45790.1 DUF3494 domain-containing protein [Glaciihabitans sp. INWT7]